MPKTLLWRAAWLSLLFCALLFATTLAVSPAGANGTSPALAATTCCDREGHNCLMPGGDPTGANASLFASLLGVNWVFDTSSFPRRWNCGTWSEALGWTHITSDLAIFGAYSAIPLVLAFFVLQRRDIPFLPIFWLFAAFILFCGLGHLVEAIIFWNPVYRFSAVVKVCTALVSWATVLALLPILPKALTLPGLASINQRLESEISDRRKVEDDLQNSYDDLHEFTCKVLDREDRVIELKREVNDLLMQLGRQHRYATEVSKE